VNRSSLGPGAEFDLIRRFLHRAPGGAGDHVLVGPGDDAAVLRDGGITLSSDVSVEGVHFRRDWLAPEEIGYRAAAAALSDLAAMAARPVGLLVSLAVAPEDAAEVAARVMAGVTELAEGFEVALLGGDLSRSPGPLVIDVTVVGRTSSPVLRVGAEPGDEVWVTGELGAAGAAVAALLRGETPRADAMARFARPTPRVAEAIWLAEQGIPRAMLDLSDGLLGDASHLSAASGVALVLEAASVPVHGAVSPGSAEERVSLAASAGEDYELCFCAAPGAGDRVGAELLRRFGVPMTRVGVVEQGAGVHWRHAGGGRSPPVLGGYQHFGGSR
jgi:thiamine-monophosphate kinase